VTAKERRMSEEAEDRVYDDSDEENEDREAGLA
jgi:hypothetical protein